MFTKRKNKPIRGVRKVKFKEFPWIKIFKTTTAVFMTGVLIFLIFSLRYHKKRSSQTLMDNLQLNESVSTLAEDLTTERDTFEAFVTQQLIRNIELEDGVEELNAALEETQEDNSGLLDQLASARLQNDILKNKLNTMLGKASRNGEELSPSPMGSSGLSIKELKVLTKGTNLAGIEEALLQIEVKNNVNALYALAVAKLETGSGTSSLCKNNNNLFGMRGRNGWYKYSTKPESVLAFGNLMTSNYFSKGYTTLEKIGPRYAEGSNSWAIKAKYHMLNDMRKLHR